MKYYISGFQTIFDYKEGQKYISKTKDLYYLLFSFEYLKDGKYLQDVIKCSNKTRNVLIDSGAYSLFSQKHTNYDKYTKQYINFIQENNIKNVTGYFEMDIDRLVGYNQVLEYRQEIEEVTDKIIPVWHNNRGIQEFKKMCNEYKYISLSCKGHVEIPVKSYHKFVKYAHSRGCMIHGLGLGSPELMKTIKFDSADSSAFIQAVKYNRAPLPYQKHNCQYFWKPDFLRKNRWQCIWYCYLTFKKMQKELIKY